MVYKFLPLYSFYVQMYQKCGLLDRAVSILEDFVKDHGYQVDQAVINLLITLQMESNEYMKALHHIDCICLTYGTGNEAPIYLKAKAVICHAHLGNLEHAEVCSSSFFAIPMNF